MQPVVSPERCSVKSADEFVCIISASALASFPQQPKFAKITEAKFETTNFEISASSCVPPFKPAEILLGSC